MVHSADVVLNLEFPWGKKMEVKSFSAAARLPWPEFRAQVENEALRQVSQLALGDCQTCVFLHWEHIESQSTVARYHALRVDIAS